MLARKKRLSLKHTLRTWTWLGVASVGRSGDLEPTVGTGGRDGAARGGDASTTTNRFETLKWVGQHASEIIVVIDASGYLLYANPTAEQTYNVSVESVLGSNAFDFIHPDDRDRVAVKFIELLQTPGVSIRDSIKTIDAHGNVREIEMVSTNSLDNPAVAGIIVNGRDVTEYNRHMAELREHEQRFRLAFEENMSPMLFSDLNDSVVAVNDAFCEMVGFTRDELLGKDSKQFTYPDDIGITEEGFGRLMSTTIDQLRYEKRYLRKDGRVVISEVSRSAARDQNGKLLYLVSSERDVTGERELTAQLSHQALHDPLTGLANRTLFEDRLSQAHLRLSRQGGYGAVLLLDLDDFKGVNDSFGHFVGDELLIESARRFQGVSRSSDTLCRLGGDEFLYLAEGLTSPLQAEAIATRLLQVLAEPMSFGPIDLEQRASIGVVIFDASNADLTDCVQDADVALYEAKRTRKNGFVIFDAAMRERAVTSFSLVQQLRSALSTDELSMYYQPIVDLGKMKVVGFEALMRWQHPERGSLPPDVFIPLAEQSGLILELSRFAVYEAVAAANSWCREDREVDRPYVTVNFSANQFRSAAVVAMIEGALDASGLAPHRFAVEITERVALADVNETMATMSSLRHLGVSIALDDFGVGYSSLSHLALLLPDIIKIDRAFVSPQFPGTHNAALLEAIVAIGHKLNITMLAEGIETREQLDNLQRLGCELGQGFLFAPAIPAGDVDDLLKQSAGFARPTSRE